MRKNFQQGDRVEVISPGSVYEGWVGTVEDPDPQVKSMGRIQVYLDANDVRADFWPEELELL